MVGEERNRNTRRDKRKGIGNRFDAEWGEEELERDGV